MVQTHKFSNFLLALKKATKLIKIPSQTHFHWPQIKTLRPNYQLHLAYELLPSDDNQFEKSLAGDVSWNQQELDFLHDRLHLKQSRRVPFHSNVPSRRRALGSDQFVLWGWISWLAGAWLACRNLSIIVVESEMCCRSTTTVAASANVVPFIDFLCLTESFPVTFFPRLLRNWNQIIFTIGNRKVPG